MKRKLLLIMPNFFDYPQAICEELEKMGYEVDCFDDRPSTNGMVKAIIRHTRSKPILWYNLPKDRKGAYEPGRAFCHGWQQVHPAAARSQAIPERQIRHYQA